MIPSGDGSDFDLAARAGDGDRAALEALITCHHQRLLGIVRRRLGWRLRRRLDSGDVLQAVFLDAVRDYSAAARREDEFLPWIARVIERTIRDQARAAGRRCRDPEAEVSLAEVPTPSCGGRGESPSAASIRAEDVSRLERALDRLSPADRRLILLSRIEGRTADEIATMSGRSPVAVRRAITRAVARLAVLMASEG